jgi:hypothetical protein
MKNLKFTKTLFLLLFLGLTFGCKAQQAQPNIQSKIVASWEAEDDLKVKLVFNGNGVYTEYYNNELINTYSYTISHQCNSEHELKAWFLKAIDQSDLTVRCYELYGADVDNNGVLSMRDMITGKIFVYNKIQ